MRYFKNTELAKLYNVSEKSVRNWIQATQDSKLNLELYENDGRFWIANTSKNTFLITQLVEKGKKYKNSRGLKVVTPKPEFYKTFDQNQVLDIVSNMAVRREIPLQYGYADGGAEAWDLYANRLTEEPHPNFLNRTLELLNLTADYLDHLLDGYAKVNLVDLGPGNGLPVRSLIQRLLDQKRLGRYIAIDISQNMLNILEQNIDNWFDGAVKFEGHTRDLSYERFGDIIVEDAGANTVNLVILFGGTLNNFRSPEQPLRTTYNSLGPADLLLNNTYLDTPNTRRYFDFDFKASSHKQLRPSRLVLGLLNVDESLYTVEQQFDEASKSRSTVIKPRVDITIKLDVPKGVSRLELRKNEPILIWRHRHYDIFTISNLFDASGFDILQMTKSADQDYMLSVSKIKTNLFIP